MKNNNKNLSREQILNILIEDYSYNLEQLKHKSKNDLIILLDKRREDQKNGTKFLKEFWVIRSMKRPGALDNDGLPGTQKNSINNIFWMSFFIYIFWSIYIFNDLLYNLEILI